MRTPTYQATHGEMPKHGEQECTTRYVSATWSAFAFPRRRCQSTADSAGSFNVLICFVSLAGGLFEIRSSCEEIFWHRSKADVRSGLNRQRPTLSPKLNEAVN
jgi:hypothetical protein